MEESNCCCKYRITFDIMTNFFFYLGKKVKKRNRHGSVGKDRMQPFQGFFKKFEAHCCC